MDAPRTQYAQKALDLASAFALTLGQERLPGYRVEMAAPEGPSTGGGKQGVQHIALVPEKGGVSVVVGSANHGAKAAELRTFGYLEAVQARRAPGTKLSFDAAAYGKLLERMNQFLSSFDISVKIVETPPEGLLPAPAEPTAAPGNPWKIIALIAGVVVIGLVVALLLRR